LTGDINSVIIHASQIKRGSSSMINTTEIKVYMTRKGDMSVKDLAKKLNISPATLGRWLDKKDMPTSAAERIIDILGIPYEERSAIFFNREVA
jgi:DNA-binding transcriptional regulator YiaG